MLQLAVVSRGVLRSERVIAKYGLVLQTVVREGRIVVTDALVDLNNKPLPVRWTICILPTPAITASAFHTAYRVLCLNKCLLLLSQIRANESPTAIALPCSIS